MAVYDETGKKVATIEKPESPEGKKVIEKLADDYTVDYAPGGSYDAPSMRESYQLGGIPGQPGFGQMPGPIPNPYSYKDGGKVKKKK
jgi:hypothetical protein